MTVKEFVSNRQAMADSASVLSLNVSTILRNFLLLHSDGARSIFADHHDNEINQDDGDSDGEDLDAGFDDLRIIDPGALLSGWSRLALVPGSSLPRPS